MNDYNVLREKLLTHLAKLERIDMNVQTNVINRCVYEMVKNKEFLCLGTLVDKCNKYYIVGSRASYGQIVPQRVLRHFGGDSRTAAANEINNRLATFGWRMLLGKTTCKATFIDKNGRGEFDLNTT